MHEPMPRRRANARYLVLGVPIAVGADDPQALELVDETYAGFRQDIGAPEPAFTAELSQIDAGTSRDSGPAVLVYDSQGYRREWPDAQAAVVDLLDRIVHGVLAELHKRDIYAIHAGATVYSGAALIVAGRSGQGKTTLTLGLLQRGLGLLSDEFAVIDPATQQIMPYRRSVHVRPGTPELIPELGYLSQRPKRRLGGGIEWSLPPASLAQAFPGCLAPAAPLRYVLLLDGAPEPGGTPAIAPAPAAVATIELLRGTWAASRDFSGGLARLSHLMNGVACARLRVGALEPTLDTIIGWLETHHG
jgi:hypothetical protein